MLRVLIIFILLCGVAFADNRTLAKPSGSITDDLKNLTGEKNSYRDLASKLIQELKNSMKDNPVADEGRELGKEMMSNKDKYIDSALASLGMEDLRETVKNQDTGCVDPEQVGDPSIYIFISASVPSATLENYAETVRALNGDGIMVLNGTIGDPKEIMPTVDFVTKLSCGKTIKELQKDQSCDMARVDINPLLFRLFGVKEVPAIVWSDVSYTELIGSVNLGETIDSNKYGIIYGDISVEHALNKFKDGLGVNIKSFMDKIKPGYFGGKP